MRQRTGPCDGVVHGAAARGRAAGRMSRLGGDRNRKMSDRVWTMTGDVAQWIRRWQGQDAVERMGGRGKRGWGGIGTLMQRDVKMANRSENTDRRVARLVLCFLD